MSANSRRRLSKVVATIVLGLFGFLSILIGVNPQKANAVNTSSTLNFQARLLTTSGAIVPDGLYNIQFKIYDGGTQGGASGTGQANSGTGGTYLWTESYYDTNGVTAGNDFRVQVINGYFSVNLGSQTAFSGINWDQELWLTMNIGGTTQTATPTYDGEMTNSNARIKLTGVPYAFSAGQLAKSSGANRGTLSFNTVANNPNLLLPDVASGTVCLQATTACGFIVNGTSSQTGNFNIQSAASGSIGAVIAGAAAQSVDLLDLEDSGGLVNAAFNSSGAQLTLGRVASSGTVTQGKLRLADGTTDNFGITLQSATLTNNRTITVPDENGIICTTAASAACTAVYAPAAGGINNTTTVQTNANFAIQSTGTGNITALIRQNTSQTADLLQLQNSSTNLLAGITASGVLKFADGAGGAYDTTLYRAGAASLETDGNFTINNLAGVGALNLNGSSTNGGSITANGALVITSGGTNTNVNIAGTGTGGVKIATGTSGNGNVQIGSTTAATNQNISIGNNATASSTDAITIGNLLGTSSTLIRGGTGASAIMLSQGSNGTVTVGDTGGSDSVAIQSGTGNITLTTNGSAASTIVKSGTAASNTAFQVQNNSGSNLLNVNTADGYVINNGASAIGNEIENPSFESGGTSDGTGWFSPSASQVITVSAANAHSGNNELQVTGNSGTHAVTTKYIAVHPGDIVYAEAYVKNSGGANGDGGIYLEFTDKDKGGSSFSNNDTGLPGTSYVLKSITATVPASDFFVRIAASVKATSSTGTFYFDDFYLKKVNEQAPALFNNDVNSATAFQVQNVAGTTLFGVDTSGGKLFTTIADSGSAIGFAFNTPSYTTSGAKLLSVQNNGAEKFSISKDGNIVNSGTINASGDITTSGNLSIGSGKTYQINGTQITSAALSNDSDLAKLSGSGPQLFTGNNKFTGTILSQGSSATAFQVQNASNNEVFTVDASGSQIVLGKASTLTGTIKFFGTGGAGSLTLVGPTTPNAGNFTLTIPAITGNANVCTDNSICTGYAAATGSTAYIQNQNSAQQPSSNFWISGTGRADTSFTTPVVDTAGAAGTIALGNTNATTINIGSASTATTNIAVGNVAHTVHIADGGTSTNQSVTIGSGGTNAGNVLIQVGSGTLQLQGQNGSTTSIANNANNQSVFIGNGSGTTSVELDCGTGNCSFGNNATDHSTLVGSSNGTSLTTVTGGTGGVLLGANTQVAAGKNLSFATGAGAFDAHLATGTFDTSTGANTLRGDTTVASAKNLTVTSGATSLTGIVGGSSTALNVASGATSNIGVNIQGASSQTANLLQLQDNLGSNLQYFDAVGNHEQLGYTDTPFGGIGSYSNLLIRSEDFSATSTWVQSGSVTGTTFDTNVAPDGNSTADKLVAAGSGAGFCQFSTTAAASTTSTFSVWLKTVSGTQGVDLRVDGGPTGCATAATVTGTVKTVTATTTWQRFSVTQAIGTCASCNIKTFIFPGGTGGTGTAVAWGAQLVIGSTPQVYVRTVSSTVAASDGVINNGNSIFIPSADSTAALQIQNAAGNSYITADSSNTQLILGKASSITGKLAFATAGGGTLTINPTSSASPFTITLPAETGTVCTSASTSAANCTNFAAATGAAGYIQNQIAGPQSSSNFYISATGKANTSFLAPTFDGLTASSTVELGNVNATTINIGGASTAATTIAGGNVAHTVNIANGATNTNQTINIGSGGTNAGNLLLQVGTGTLQLQGQNSSSISIGTNSNNQTIGIGNATGNTGVQIDCGTNACLFGNTATDHVTTVGSTTGGSLTTITGGTNGVALGANTQVAAGKNLSFATGAGAFDAHLATGTFDTSTGANTLRGDTTVSSAKNFTVTAGASSLTGAAAGSGTAVNVAAGAASNIGFNIQGATSQTANLFQLQNNVGGVFSTLHYVDPAGNSEQLGYLDTPFGGLGNYANLITFSEQLDNAQWVKTTASATADQVAAPDSKTTADTIHATSSGGSLTNSSATAVSNNNFTFSVWLKTAASTQNVDLRIDGSSSGTGTAKTVVATTTWQRFSVTQNANALGGNVKVDIFPGTVSGTDSQTVYAWGAQLVLASVPQVYVRTVGATVAASNGLINNGNSIFIPSTDSVAAFQVQNATAAKSVFAVDTTNGQIVLGTQNTGGVNGKIVFNNSSNTNAVSLVSATGGNGTITLPAEVGTVCTSAVTSTANCTNFAAASGAGGYIQNQIAGPQATSNFYISNVGKSDTSFNAPAFDALAASGTTAFGNVNATTINIGGASGATTNIAAGNFAHTINIAAGATTTNQSITIGSTGSGTSTVGLQVGTSGTIQLQGQNGSAINIANNSNNQAVTIGNLLTGSSTLIQGGTAAGAISLQGGSGGTILLGTVNANAISLGGNTTLAAGKSLLITGDIFANRPGGTPTAGTLFYDTTNKELIQYNGTKWISDRNTATFIVAASNSSQVQKDAADYVATGTGDQATINSALTAVSSSSPAGGTVYLLSGTYKLSASISVPNNVTLAGDGSGTIITIPNAQNGAYGMIINTDTSTGTHVNIQGLLLDGNIANQTSGNMEGILLTGLGSGSGSSARDGGKLTNVIVKGTFGGPGIYLNGSSNNIISNVTSNNNGNYGIGLSNTSINNTLTGNLTQGNTYGIVSESSSGNNTISGNTSQGNSQYGIYINNSSNNTISGNTVITSSNTGVFLSSANLNTVTGNNVQSNTFAGIQLSASSQNVISGNKVQNSGGNSTNNGIYFTSSATKNSVTGNDISDTSCTTDCYAINVSDSGSTGNYISANHIAGDGTHLASINNAASTNTTYANQELSETGDAAFHNGTNSTTAFQIQNAGSAQLINVDTTNPITDLTNNQANNLVANGSFEAGTTGWVKMGSTQTAVAQDNTSPYLGNSSLKVVTNASDTTATDGAKLNLTTSTLVANTKYNLVLSARTLSGTTMAANFEVGYNLGSGGDVACLTAQTVVSTGWTNYSCSFTVGTTTGTPYIYAKINNQSANTYYLDAVSLSRVSLLSNASAEQTFAAGDWQTKSSATISRDTGQFQDGAASVKIITAASTASGVQHNQTLNDSTQYYLSFYAKLDAASTALTTMEAGYAADGSTDTPCITGQTVVTTGWTNYTCTFTTPSSHSGTPYIYVKGNVASARTFYVDNVQLSIGNPIGAYREGQIDLNGVINSPVTIQGQTNSTTAFQVQNATGFNVLVVDTVNRQLKVFENGGSTNYASIYYDTATNTANYTANSGTVAVGQGAGSITLTAGTSAAINITANDVSLWKTTSGTLTLQSGAAADLILAANGTVTGSKVTVSGAHQLVLGSNAGDPGGTCVVGAIIYNSSTNTLRGCQGSTPIWNDLVNITPSLQLAYTNSTHSSSVPEIILSNTTGGALDIQGDNAGSLADLFNVRAGAAGALGQSLFDVANSGNVTINSSGGAIELSTAITDVSIGVGNGTGNTSNQIILVLNNYEPLGTGTSGAIAEQDGGMYYNADQNIFECGLGSAVSVAAESWTNCAINSIQSSYVFEDEFLSGAAQTIGTTSLTGVGNLGWNMTTNSSTGTAGCAVAYNQNTSGTLFQHDHPGTLRLTTNTTANDSCILNQGGTAAGTTTLSEQVGAGDVFKSAFAVSTATGTMRVGWSNQTVTTAPTSGAWWQYTGGNLQYCYANNTTAVCATAATLAVNTWAEVEIYINSSSNITFVSNIAGTTTTNTTSSAFDAGSAGGARELSPGASCNTTGSAQNCYVDYIQWSGVNLLQTAGAGTYDGVRD